jgi:hypothetical protein
LVETLQQLLREVKRIADHFDPPPPNVVDTGYVAHRIGRTATRIAQMAREGIIPSRCIFPGRGEGGLWKFYRDRIEEWMSNR